MTDEERLVWGRFEKLERRVLEQGETLELSGETRSILIGGARLVAISPVETEDALRGVSTAMTLLREISRPLGEGAKRLPKADTLAGRLQRRTGEVPGNGRCAVLGWVLAWIRDAGGHSSWGAIPPPLSATRQLSRAEPRTSDRGPVPSCSAKRSA